MAKCKKSTGNRKDPLLARANTLRNKIRKFTRIVKKNPHDLCAINTLIQYKYDLENLR